MWTEAIILFVGIARHRRKRRDERFYEKADEASAHERKVIKCLSMRVVANYIRDEPWSLPSGSGICNTVQREIAPLVNKLIDADPRVVQDDQFWRRMEDCGVSEEDEWKVGIAHYVRSENHPERGVAPTLVITCRGTILYHCQDLEDNFHVGRGRLLGSRRYQKCEVLIIKIVQHFRARYGGDDPADIWIAGHSLGADIGLLAGMALSEQGMKVSLMCFNSPFLTIVYLARKLFLINSFCNMLWDVKEMLEEICSGLELLSDQFLTLNDLIKWICAYTLDGEELDRQLQRFEALEMGPVRMCVNECDFICGEFVKFYRRNHKKGRFLLSSQAICSKILPGKGLNNYFCMPPSVTMFWTKDPEESHSLKQWFDPNIVMKKVDFQLR